MGDRFDHLCRHGKVAHQCHCGMGADHTSTAFDAWIAEQDIQPLDGEVR